MIFDRTQIQQETSDSNSQHFFCIISIVLQDPWKYSPVLPQYYFKKSHYCVAAIQVNIFQAALLPGFAYIVLWAALSAV